MAVEIERARFGDPQLAEFLQDHLDELAPTAPAESQHALSLDELRASSARLWIAREDAEVVGMGALAPLAPHHDELKSMRTHPARRGTGVGSRLLGYLLADARARGIQRISLETGSMAFFAPARALYARAGFVPCAPFGSYVLDENSTYLTMVL